MNQHDTVATTQHSSGSSGGGLLAIEPGLMIWSWVVFGLLFVVLRKYAWKPMMESIRAREKVLADAVDNARKTKEELEQIAQQQKQLISQAEDEAKQLIGTSRKKAEDVARSIVDKARTEADKSLERAREQMEHEKELVLRQIRQESVDLIIQASEKLISSSLDDEKHRTIVKKHLEEM